MYIICEHSDSVSGKFLFFASHIGCTYFRIAMRHGDPPSGAPAVPAACGGSTSTLAAAAGGEVTAAAAAAAAAAVSAGVGAAHSSLSSQS